MRRTHFTHIAVVATLCCIAVIGVADVQLPWSTIDGGGGISSGGTFEVSGTIGQPDAGAMAGGTFAVVGGFWPAIGVSGDVPTPVSCMGDITNAEGTGPDGVVDGFDLLSLLGSWGPCPAPCAADLTNAEGTGPDGVVDGFDLLSLLGNWGPCPTK